MPLCVAGLALLRGKQMRSRYECAVLAWAGCDVGSSFRGERWDERRGRGFGRNRSHSHTLDATGSTEHPPLMRRRRRRRRMEEGSFSLAQSTLSAALAWAHFAALSERRTANQCQQPAASTPAHPHVTGRPSTRSRCTARI